MNLGGKHTMQGKMAAVESRLGKTTGTSTGSKPAPAPKVKPVLGKGKIGAKVTWKF